LCCSCTFLVLVALMIVSNIFYALTAPFLPPVFEAKDVDEGYVGLIFAAFSVSSVLMSPQVTRLSDRFHATTLVFWGLVLMGISNFFFGIIEDMNGEAAIVSVAIALRLVQGVAGALLNVSCYSLASMWWPNDVEMALSLLEACSGIGMILGPIVGSAIYTGLGFKFSFYLLGASLVPIAFATYCFFLRRIKRADSDFVDAASLATVSDAEKISFVSTTDVAEEVQESQVTNWSLMKDRRVIFACLSGTLAFFTDTQLEPIFARRLEDFSMSTFQIGLMFTLIPATYIPTMLLIPYVKIEKRTILIVSAFLLGCATFLNGPSELFHMPGDKLYLIMMGQALTGIFIATLSIPALPEMIDASEKNYSEREVQRVHSLCAGLYNASLGLGQTLGPTISAVLFAAVGFRLTQDIIAISCIVFAIAYLLFGSELRICGGPREEQPTEQQVQLNEKLVGSAINEKA